MSNLVLFSGPCQVESEFHAMRMVETMLNLMMKRGLHYDFYYKSSFDKANRMSIGGARGVGMSEGLRILWKLKEEFGVKVITDVHECWQVGEVAFIVDVIQVPAMLCRQTDLLLLCGKSGCGVNVKKGQFMAPRDMKYVVEKVHRSRYDKGLSLWVTERGTTFGHNDLVVDMRGLREMSLHSDVVIDCTHSVQSPGGLGGSSGGDRKQAPLIAKAAIATGYVSGVFAEVHDDPDNALSDGATSLTMDMWIRLLEQLEELYGMTERWKLDWKKS